MDQFQVLGLCFMGIAAITLAINVYRVLTRLIQRFLNK